MSEPVTVIASRKFVCRYCRLASDISGPACSNCGAPVDVREIQDDAGWVEQPPVRDMAHIQFGRSRCQISGTYVPMAEMDLGPDDSVYFSHHVLLWTDPTTRLDARAAQWGRDRRMAGMPLVMMEATGPGRIAFSDDHPGEIIAVPLEPGGSIDVAEHHFLVASGTVSYTWFNPQIWWNIGSGKNIAWHYPLGPYMDRFSAEQRGLLLLHARGNTFIRDLQAEERIYVAPRALVYKDRSVHMNIHMERPASPRAHWRLSPLIRLMGPGRVAIQSKYEVEPESHWGWSKLGPDGTWSNWNPDPSRYRPVSKDREP
jgi:uncharacterized protein (AIM24 family)